MPILINLISISKNQKKSELIKVLRDRLKSLRESVDILIHTEDISQYDVYQEDDNITVKEYEAINIKKCLKNTVLYINNKQIDCEKIYDVVINILDSNTKQIKDIIGLSSFSLKEILNIVKCDYKTIAMLSEPDNNSPSDKILSLNFMCSAGIFRILVSGLRTINKNEKSEIAFSFMSYRLNLPVIGRAR